MRSLSFGSQAGFLLLHLGVNTASELLEDLMDLANGSNGRNTAVICKYDYLRLLRSP